MQKYNLFFNEIVLSIVIYDKNQLKYVQKQKKLLFEENAAFDEAIDIFLNQKKHVDLYCSKENKAKLVEKLKENFCYQKTAGGIVYNTNEKILVMLRLGHYDFPKGHIEGSETPMQAAVREVKEETAIDNVTVKKYIGNSFHVYVDQHVVYLKENVWFSMLSENRTKLKPQTEEGIEDLFWLDKDEIREKIDEFYPSLQHFIVNKLL